MVFFPKSTPTAGIQRERFNLTSLRLLQLSWNLRGSHLQPLFGRRHRELRPSRPQAATRRQIESAAAHAEAQVWQAQATGLTLTGQVATQAATIAAVRAEIAVDDAVVGRRTAKSLTSLERPNRRGERPPAAALGRSASSRPTKRCSRRFISSSPSLATLWPLLVGKAPADWTAPDFDLAELKGPS